MRPLLFLSIVFYALQANAQPYSISFSGTGISTVKVQNLTTGVIADVPAGDVLLLSATTDVPEVNNRKSSGLKVYPNPMTDKSTLEILPPLAGNAIISVCDMTGKVLTQYKGYLENHKQEFSLSGIKNGLHIITVQGNGFQFSEKLLSNGISNGTPGITKISNNIQPLNEKKSLVDSKGVQGNVEMDYNSGERLKYMAVSGSNITVMTDIPTANKTINFRFTECKDGDNNYYPVVQINTQLWMAENLKTTKYNDGTAIPNITDNTAWNTLTTGAYCDYSNNSSNSITNGRLYNWYTVDNNAGTKVVSNGGKNVCPTGWHVPTDTEWTTLENYLITNGYNWDGTTTGNKIAKSIASTSGWSTDANAGSVGNDQPSNNRSGFTALPSGYRKISGSYCNLSYYCFWWYSTEFSTSDAYYRLMMWSYESAERSNFSKRYGFSVRCLRD
jgi:uncharacterized protein (TIGR02145 family)